MSVFNNIASYLQADSIGQAALQLLSQQQQSLETSFAAYCQYLQTTNQLVNGQIPQNKMVEFAELMKANILVVQAPQFVAQNPPQTQQTLNNNHQAWQTIKRMVAPPQTVNTFQQTSFPTTQYPVTQFQTTQFPANSIFNQPNQQASIPAAGNGFLTTVGTPPPPPVQPVPPVQEFTPTPTPAEPTTTPTPIKTKTGWQQDNRPWSDLKPNIKITGDEKMDSSAMSVLARLSGAGHTQPIESQKPQTPNGALRIEHKPDPKVSTAPRTLSEVISAVLLSVHMEQLSGHTSQFVSRCVFSYSTDPEKASKQRALFKNLRSRSDRKGFVRFINDACHDEHLSPEEKVLAIMLNNMYAKRLAYMYRAVLNLKSENGSVIAFKNLSSADSLVGLIEVWNSANPVAIEQLNKQTVNVFRNWLTEREDGLYEDIAVVGWPVDYKVFALSLTSTQSAMLTKDNGPYEFIFKQQLRLIRAANEQDYKPKVYYHVTLDGTLLEVVPSGFDNEEFIVTLAQE